ncbi:MAG: hypothetical protein WC222_11600 [Parachlamydiales bacterium]|jgi:hypothetical protein
MTDKIKIALENLNKAILEELNEMSNRHKKTLQELERMKQLLTTYDQQINKIINTLAIMCFCKSKTCNRCGFTEPMKKRCENEIIRTELFKKLDMLKGQLPTTGEMLDSMCKVDESCGQSQPGTCKDNRDLIEEQQHLIHEYQDEITKLKFMIDNGLGWKDLENDNH